MMAVRGRLAADPTSGPEFTRSAPKQAPARSEGKKTKWKGAPFPTPLVLAQVYEQSQDQLSQSPDLAEGEIHLHSKFDLEGHDGFPYEISSTRRQAPES
jgi:hypothetical protein